MILSKLVFKTLFLSFHFKHPFIRHLFLQKNKWINWRDGVDVSDDVTTTKAIRRVNYKMVLCFDTSMSTSDNDTTICKGIPA